MKRGDCVHGAALASGVRKQNQASIVNGSDGQNRKGHPLGMDGRALLGNRDPWVMEGGK